MFPLIYCRYAIYLCRRSMIRHLLFLDQSSYALKRADFVSGVKENTIWMKLQVREASFAKIVAQADLVGAVDFLYVEDQLIHFQRIVVHLPQFDLPCANIRHVVK